MNDSPSPAFKIKQIESNLKSLSTQIQILSRAENHNIKSLEKCFDQCIPLIKSKIEQSKQHFKVKRLYQETLQEKQNRVLGIKLKKYDDMKKKTNIKSLIYSIKHKQANQIRQQSVKHTQLMKQQKIKQQQQKVKKSLRIKSQQSFIQQKIRSFHTEKLQDLSRIKKREQQQKESRIKRSVKMMQKINQQKMASQQKFNQTHTSLRNLRQAIQKLKFMKPQQFSRIMNETLGEGQNSSSEGSNTINQSNINESNINQSNINSTILQQMNGYESPIYSRQSRFTAGEQLITSKIINRMLVGKETREGGNASLNE